ncbi:MAG: ROK family protein [Planctomycetaceae bacterium]|nr:ROK family protein [Planctomycetaceae bacterium]MCP4462993.1 ROK family protein [Planctomycetaceae bacterium]MDG1810185.1 ROK family protein [Pirellulaceae bacterium]MDG2103462.1 ROK family protein [Pirellulaceae bacterium]
MGQAGDYWVGFDLGGTKMLAVVYDASFQVAGRARKKTKGYEGKKAGLERIVNVVREALADAGVEPRQLAGIGIGCPGPLDIQQGIIHEAPNLGWKNVPIKETLQKEFNCPAIVGNDVDVGVYGEYRFGAGRDANCVVGIFPGTGVGGGCVYQGKLIQGKNCTAMEIGHIQISSEGAMDGAGNCGTLESLCSRLAISSEAAAAAYRGQAPFLLKDTGTDIANIRSGALAKSVKEDQAVKKIMESAIKHLATGVVTMIHLMAPDVIVLGGGLVEAMPEFFVTNVTKCVNSRVLPAYRDVFKVVPAELGDDAAVMGAAAWAQEAVKATV